MTYLTAKTFFESDILPLINNYYDLPILVNKRWKVYLSQLLDRRKITKDNYTSWFYDY